MSEFIVNQSALDGSGNSPELLCDAGKEYSFMYSGMANVTSIGLESVDGQNEVAIADTLLTADGGFIVAIPTPKFRLIVVGAGSSDAVVSYGKLVKER